MNRNIKLLYAFKAIRAFYLIIPILVPFFQDLGLNLTEIYILDSIWAITILICEVPSGYFADKAGRKLSIVLGSILGAAAYSIYNFANGFEILFVANIIMGLSYCFVSGADSAMAFDSFVVNKKELEYLDFESKSVSLAGIFQVAASLIGGILALVSLQLPVLGQAITYAIAIPLSLLLKETPHLKKSSPSLKELLAIGKNVLFERKDILFLILVSALIGNMTHTLIWIIQPFYKLVGIPLYLFGALWALQYLVLAFASRFSEKLEKSFGKTQVIIASIILGNLSYFIIGFAPFAISIVMILVLYAIRGSFKPIFANSLNKLLESRFRATVFSIESLVRKLLYAILGPLIGFIADNQSIASAFTWSGIIYSFFGLFIIYQIVKKDRI